MIELKSIDYKSELKEFCQKWLSCLADGKYERAEALIDSPNCYGLIWNKMKIEEAIQDYFCEPTKIEVQNLNIEQCKPSFLVRDDGGLLYDFNLPINGEVTDLTVQFEFEPRSNGKYEVVIHDIHVL